MLASSDYTHYRHKVITAIFTVALVFLASASVVQADSFDRRALGQDTVAALAQFVAAQQLVQQHKETGALEALLKAMVMMNHADGLVKKTVLEGEAFSELSQQQKQQCVERLMRCETTGGYMVACGAKLAGCLHETITGIKLSENDLEIVPLAFMCFPAGYCICDSVGDCETMRKKCCKGGTYNTLENTGGCMMKNNPPEFCGDTSSRSIESGIGTPPEFVGPSFPR
jgi:hypothetical protein